jgi:hypothetical protein
LYSDPPVVGERLTLPGARGEAIEARSGIEKDEERFEGPRVRLSCCAGVGEAGSCCPN